MNRMKEKKTKFEPSVLRLVRTSLAVVLILCGATLFAQEKEKKDGTSNKSWTLGITRATWIPKGNFMGLPIQCSIQELSNIIMDRTNLEHPLSDSLPVLLYNHIRPLPDRYMEGQGNQLIRITVKDPEKEGYISLNTDISEIKSDALLIILYDIDTNEFRSKTYYVEVGKNKASLISNETGTIFDLDSFAPKVASSMFSVLANYPVVTYDFDFLPKGAMIQIASSSKERIPLQIKGTRLFFGEGSAESLRIHKEGYKPKIIENLGQSKHPYQRMSLVLEHVGESSISNVSDSMAETVMFLEWQNKKEFDNATKKFLSSIGRVVITLPLAAVSLGTFFSYYEAYSRLAVAQKDLIVPGIIGAVSLAATSVCLVDMAIQLGYRIKVSK